MNSTNLTQLYDNEISLFGSSLSYQNILDWQIDKNQLINILNIIKQNKILNKDIKKSLESIWYFLLWNIEEIMSSKNIDSNTKSNLLELIIYWLNIFNSKTIYNKIEKKDEEWKSNILYKKLIQLRNEVISIFINKLIFDLSWKDLYSKKQKEKINWNIDLILKNRIYYYSEYVIFKFLFYISNMVNLKDFEKEYLKDFESYINKNEKYGENYSNDWEFAILLIEYIRSFILNDINKCNILYKKMLLEYSSTYSSREMYILSFTEKYINNFT